MGDSQDGSSRAAHGAQSPDPENPGGDSDAGQGFFHKMFSAFAAGEAEEHADDRRTDEPPEPALPGMANLSAMRIEDVMLPKAEIVAVPDDITAEELAEVFRTKALSRLPVYRGTLDSPIGMVHLKDFALRHGFNGGVQEFDLQSMLRPLLYAPPSMPIGVLLQKMQSDRMHMALVIDEYGGVDGLVTIEDVIEQVIGEIEDEHDIAEGAFWTEEADGAFVAQARAPIEDFEAAIGRRITPEADEEEIDTLGGLVFVLAGRVPSRGECIHGEDGTEYEVIDADPRRIKRLRVRLASGD